MKNKLLILVISFLLINSSLFAQRWEPVDIPQAFTTTYWLDVYFLPSNPNYGWICGFGGSVLRTTDGGDSWQGTTIPGADHLESIHFPSISVGYTSGQEGIYKSTDGGSSWNDITPPSSTINLWGCYFLDNNNGFVIGGGCTTDQNFWRTTDGGLNWTLFSASEPNTGLTDLIVYNMSGNGYASSSGWIWQTNDGGQTWSKFSNTGAHDWQEEITKVGNSFLVPFATSCNGGGGGGGMRFSDDNGTSWKNHNLNVRMFGAFLLNSTTGWVAGDSRNVWYTSDAGDNWELRNCGFNDGNLDDIWFISPNNGWIVGEGVYKLSDPLQTTDKDELIFSDICIPQYQEIQFDIENINFNPDDVTLSILNDPLDEYTIENANTRFTINTCGSERITIRFTPKDIGLREAILRIEFDYGTVKDVNLSGYGAKRTVTPEDSLLIINPAYCNKQNYNSLTWTAETPNESIRYIDYLSGDKNIYSLTTMPMNVSESGSQTLFSANPIDTGWISAKFICDFIPCSDDTTFTVMAYGVSPIITSQTSLSFSQQCDEEDIDTITVFNTGNEDLVISNTRLLESNTNFEIIGWEDNPTQPFIIPVDSSSKIVVKYSHNDTKTDYATLSIENNDSTSIRGNKNPYNINLYGYFGESKLFVQDSVFDFGNICIGAENRYTFFLKNIGNLPLELIEPSDSSEFTVNVDAISRPIILGDNDSVRVTITFKPNKTGPFKDTITFHTSPCEQQTDIIVSGNGISASIKIIPNNIQANLQTNKPYKTIIQVQSFGTEDVLLTNAEITPIVQNININLNPPLNQPLSANSVIDFELEITATSDTIFDGFLCFTGEGNCNCGSCVPIHLESYSSNVYLDTNILDFGLQTCNEPNITDSIAIINSGFLADTILSVLLQPQNSAFSIVNPIPKNYTIEANDTLYLKINFNTQIEENHSATITINTSTGNNERTLLLNGEYRKTNTTPDIVEINIGDIEQCDIPYQQMITLANQGTLNDSILISTTDPNLVLSPDNYILVDAGSQEQITIIFDPTKYPVGSLDESIIFESAICNDISTIQLTANVFHPYLTYVPNQIEFIDPWFDEMNFTNLAVYNNSGYDKQITGLMILDNTNFKLVNNYNFPINFKPNDSLKIPISFFTDVEGQFSTQLEIVEESICIDSTYIDLSANIPLIDFETTVSIGNYTAKPDETIDVEVSIDKPLNQLRHKGIKYQFSFDPYLFYPTTLIVKEGENGFTVPFENYSNGVISGTLDTNFSKNLLKQNGDILLIKGLVLFSSPDTTTLNIDTFEPITGRNVTINKENGFLTLFPVCQPLAKFRLKFINPPTVKLYENPITDGILNVKINYDFASDCKIELFNVQGQSLIRNQNNLQIGGNKLDIQLNDIQNGFYFVKFDIDGFIFIEKIIIIN